MSGHRNGTRRALPPRLLGAVILALAPPWLWGCEAPPASIMVAGPGTETAKDQEKSAGQDQLGEACTYQPSGQPTGPDFTQAIDVFCGNATLPSGHIFVAAQAVSTDRLEAVALSSSWRTALDQHFTCAPPTTERLAADRPVWFLLCAQRAGWPHVAYVTNEGSKTFLADGVPSATPALLSAIAGLSGGASLPETERSSAALLISRKIASKPFGSGDLQDYNEFRGLGERAFDDLDYASAEASYRAAVAIKTKFLGPDNAGLAGPLMNQALAISNQSRFNEADRLFARVGSLLAAHPDPLMKAELDFYLGAHAANQGRIDEAKTGIAQAEREYTRLVPDVVADPGGELWGGIGSGRADQLANDVFISADEEIAISGLASAGWYESLLAYRSGDYAGAATRAAAVRRLLTATRLNAPGYAPRSVATAALSVGREGLFAASDSGLDQAANLFERTHQDRLQAKVLFLRGKSAAARGDDATALAKFRSAAALLKRSELGLPRLYIEPYLAVLASEAEKSGANTGTLATELFDALQLIETSEGATTVAEAYARLSTEPGGKRDVIRAIQDADDNLAQLYIDLDAEQGKPPELQNRKAIDAINQQIAAAQQKKNDALNDRLSAVPEYEQLLPASVSAASIDKLLKPEEGLLQIRVGATSSYAVLITSGSVTSYRIALGERDLAARVHALRQTIEMDDNGHLPVFDVAAAHALFTDLLGPAAAKLATLKRLVVVPSGPLTALPLEILVTDAAATPTDGNYAAVPFLVEKLALSYFASPQNFLVQRQHIKPSAASAAYIGFGGFIPATAKQLAVSFPPESCKEDLEALEALPPLEGTRKEVAYVGTQIFHAPSSDIVLGADFTREKLLNTDLSRYRILHLATHALLPTDLHCRTEPLIVLSVPPRSPSAAPGFLGFRDILALKLDAELVVLSACNTGPNGNSTGEQLSELAKGFFFAGARGLLVTHWELDDRSGPLLTAFTLNPAVGGGDTATALRAAQLALIHDVSKRFGPAGNFYTHPFSWGAFVLIGDGVAPKES